MRAMSGLEYFFLCKELSPLVGRRLSKIQLVGERIFRLKFGDAEVLVEPGIRMHLTRYVKEAEEANSFVEFAKKYLDGKILRKIGLVGTDRIVKFDFDEASLVFEMFGKGNAMVVDNSGRIMRPLVREEWRDRTIAAGRQYAPPPSKNLPFEPTEAEISSLMTEKFAISCLSALPHGITYLKVALAAAGISEKKPGNSLSSQEISSIAKKLREIAENTSPLIYSRDGKPVEFSLCALPSLENAQKTEAKTLSEAADEYYAHASTTSGEDAKEKRLLSMQERLSMQEARLAEIFLEAEECQKAGKMIMQNAPQLDAKLEEIKKDKKGKAWKDGSVEIEL
jgi:predicted ribosome quality control (RQC) complex YloA/Tae2 family protein